MPAVSSTSFRKIAVDKNDLNTAWTIDLIIKTGLWLILMISSPFAASYFEQPQLEQALYVGSFILIINAAKNPGLFLLKQNFDYDYIFRLSVVQKLASFAVAIVIAVQYRSFWALIIADIVASIIFTLGSYFIHAHRPKLCLLKIKEQWHFSQWLLFKGVIGYTRSQIDTLLVSKFFPAAQLGHYYMARDIAMMPSHNLLQPAIEPLLAAFKTARNQKDKLENQVNLSLFVVALIAIPTGIYIWYFPAPIIGTLLGDQWTGANEVLGVMALLFLYFSFIQIFEQLMIAMQKVKALFLYDLFSLVFIFIVLYSLISDQLVEFALLRGLLGVVTTLAIFVYIRSFLRIGNVRLLVMIAIVALTGIALASMILLIPMPAPQWPLSSWLLPARCLLEHMPCYFMARVVLWRSRRLKKSRR